MSTAIENIVKTLVDEETTRILRQAETDNWEAARASVGQVPEIEEALGLEADIETLLSQIWEKSAAIERLVDAARERGALALEHDTPEYKDEQNMLGTVSAEAVVHYGYLEVNPEARMNRVQARKLAEQNVTARLTEAARSILQPPNA